MPRFVILEHDHPILHWDLMLEAGDALHTWRLPQPPSSASPLTATRIGLHRLVYLDYEGPVSGNRGQVQRWDAGSFTWVQESETVLEVRLSGTRLAGLLRLEWQAADEWRVVFVTD